MATRDKDDMMTSTREIMTLHLEQIHDRLTSLDENVNKLHTRTSLQEEKADRVLHILEGNGKPGLIAEHNDCKAERVKLAEWVNEQKQAAKIRGWIKYGIIATLAGLATFSGGKVMDGGKLDKIEKAIEKLEAVK